MYNAIIFWILKFFDLSLIGIYTFLGGLIVSLLINFFFVRRDKSGLRKLKDQTKEQILKELNIFVLLLDIFLLISANMIGVKLWRGIMKKIPFPFDGINGYNHYETKELGGNVIMAFSFLTLQPHLKNIIYALGHKLNVIPESEVKLYSSLDTTLGDLSGI